MKRFLTYIILVCTAYFIGLIYAYSPLDSTVVYPNLFGNALIAVGVIYLIIAFILYLRSRKKRLRGTSDNGYIKQFFILGTFIFLIGLFMSIWYYNFYLHTPEMGGDKTTWS